MFDAARHIVSAALHYTVPEILGTSGRRYDRYPGRTVFSLFDFSGTVECPRYCGIIDAGYLEATVPTGVRHSNVSTPETVYTIYKRRALIAELVREHLGGYSGLIVRCWGISLASLVRKRVNMSRQINRVR